MAVSVTVVFGIGSSNKFPSRSSCTTSPVTGIPASLFGGSLKGKYAFSLGRKKKSLRLPRQKNPTISSVFFNEKHTRSNEDAVTCGIHQVLEAPWERMVGFNSKDQRQKLVSTPQAVLQAQAFSSARLKNTSNDQRRTKVNCVSQPRDTPPARDTGIASEKDWGIKISSEVSNDSGTNEDGSTWFRECGEDLGENGYRCRYTVMGGRSSDGSTEWKETWWEKCDWTGYKELGAEKSGKNAEGDAWWETWQEILRQDELSNLARIERTAQKQAKQGNGEAGWYEKWWEKYNAKGWTEKGAHKYGRLNEQSWWEKWGEQYDGRGAVLKWTDKWAENATGEKWGDKWEEKFQNGAGTRQGETWHASNAESWSRTWGEEHFGDGKVHKYGKSTSGENWDSVVTETTVYNAEPHYGWVDAIGQSTQLLSIEPRPRPPGVYPDLPKPKQPDQ